MATLNEFRSNFFGVRANRFLVEGNWPTGVQSPELNNLYIYVKAADIPGSTIGSIPINWQGRALKFSGDRVYADWAISVYDSSIPSNDLRAGFERWMEAMNGRNTNAINYNLTTDWVVRYSDTPGSTSSALPTQAPSNFSKAVRLKNCFPTDIGVVSMNYDTPDTFADFTVQIAYDYWEPYAG